MKIQNIVFWAFILLVVSCKKDSNNNTVPTKMSATISGKQWESLTRTTILQTNSNVFVITGVSLSGEVLAVTIYGSTPGTYDLTIAIPIKAQCAGSYMPSVASSDVYLSSTGTVVLSKVDKTARKISGTFSFTLNKTISDTKSVTNGVFNDLLYEEQTTATAGITN
jgi:hypothetical protein